MSAHINESDSATTTNTDTNYPGNELADSAAYLRIDRITGHVYSQGEVKSVVGSLGSWVTGQSALAGALVFFSVIFRSASCLFCINVYPCVTYHPIHVFHCLSMWLNCGCKNYLEY